MRVRLYGGLFDGDVVELFPGQRIHVASKRTGEKGAFGWKVIIETYERRNGRWQVARTATSIGDDDIRRQDGDD